MYLKSKILLWLIILIFFITREKFNLPTFFAYENIVFVFSKNTNMLS